MQSPLRFKLKSFKQCFPFLICLLSPILLKSQLNVGNLLTNLGTMEIPFRDADKEIKVQAQIKGRPCQFILDTGAPVFISEALQSEYKFPVVFEANVNDASGKKDKTIIVQIDTLTVGPFVYTDLLALVLHVEVMNQGCNSIEGNFGSTALRFLKVQFDLKNEKMILSTDEKALSSVSASDYQPAFINGQSDFIFPIYLNADQIDTIHFDSGDGSFLEMNPVSLEALTSHYPSQVMRQGTGITSMGSLGPPDPSLQRILVTPVKIHDISFPRAVIHSTQAGRSRLGRQLLNYGILTMDYPNSRYALKPYDHPIEKEVVDFGFQALVNKSSIQVGIVWQDSKACHKGLKFGDKIININGVNFETLDPCVLSETLNTQLKSKKINITCVNHQLQEKKYHLKKRVLTEASR